MSELFTWMADYVRRTRSWPTVSEIYEAAEFSEKGGVGRLCAALEQFGQVMAEGLKPSPQALPPLSAMPTVVLADVEPPAPESKPAKWVKMKPGACLTKPPASWPTTPISPEDMAAIERINWAAFPRETVIRVVQAWNGGMDTKPMAADLGCRPASLTMTLGKLTTVGVRLRKASSVQRIERPDPAPVLDADDDQPPIPAAPAAIPDPQIARLRKMAPFDPLARRALERMGLEV